MERLDRRERIVLAAFVSFALAIYAVYSVLRHEIYLTSGYDLGIFDQAMRGYAAFDAPTVSLKGGANLLGDHFHPVLVLLVPLYWVWDDPRVLLLAQSVLVASSIVPVYLMARHRLEAWTARGITFAYAFGWPVQSLVDFDFHEVAFALPLLAWTLYYVDRERYGAAVLTSFGLLFVREDMGLVLLMLGVVLLVRKRWVEAAVVSVVGIGAYYAVTAAIIPAIAPEGYLYWTYDALGKDLPSAVGTVVTHPVRALRIFLDGTKGHTVYLILVQNGFLGLLSPYALLAAPLAAGMFFSSRPNTWRTEFHYSAPLAVILVFALVDVVRRIARVSNLVPRVLAGLLVFITVGGMWVDWDLYPLALLPRWADNLDADRVRDARAALAAVPPGVCVEADNLLAPHLTRTNDVALPGGSNARASWIVLDMAQPQIGGTPPSPAPATFLVPYLTYGWEVRARHGAIWVLHRPGPDNRDCR